MVLLSIGKFQKFFLEISIDFFRFIFAQSEQFTGMQLPDEDDEHVFKVLISLAFGLKFISIIHLIIKQTSIDIFFIDWEREKPVAEGDQGKKLFFLDLIEFCHINVDCHFLYKFDIQVMLLNSLNSLTLSDQHSRVNFIKICV